jgi:hypothetical protein
MWSGLTAPVCSRSDGFAVSLGSGAAGLGVGSLKGLLGTCEGTIRAV